MDDLDLQTTESWSQCLSRPCYCSYFFFLTEEEEDYLEQWINDCAVKGFPKREDDVINSVSYYLKKKKRLSKFINGEKWFKLFLKRQSNLSFRTPEAVTAASGTVSEKDVRGWFKQIEDHL